MTMTQYTAHDTALAKFGYVNLIEERKPVLSECIRKKPSRLRRIKAHRPIQRVVRYFHVNNAEFDVVLPISRKELREIYLTGDPMMTKVAAWIEEKLKAERSNLRPFFILVAVESNHDQR